MQKILLLNGGQAFKHSGGRLNLTLQWLAVAILKDLGKETRECEITAGYDIEEQIANILWADALIWQMPGW